MPVDIKVILLPGLPGTTLRKNAPFGTPNPQYADWIDGADLRRNEINPNLNSDIVWPPTLGSIASRRPIDYDALSNPGLLPVCPIWGYSAGGLGDLLPLQVSIYSPLVTSIRAINRVQKPNVVGFGFDWRKDFREAAVRLADFITLRMKWTKTSDKIVLVAHSTGGLVARAMLESPSLAQHEALKRVKALVTLGTPQLGTPIALQAACGIDVGGFPMKPDLARLAADPRYPGLYQLFPHAGQPALQKPVGGKDTKVDLYKPENYKPLGLSEANIDAARAFHKLMKAAKRSIDIPYTLICGDRIMTTKYIVAGAGEPTYVEDRDGDGTVPLKSALAKPRDTDNLVVIDHVTHGNLLVDGASVGAVRDAIEKVP